MTTCIEPINTKGLIICPVCSCGHFNTSSAAFDERRHVGQAECMCVCVCACAVHFMFRHIALIVQALMGVLETEVNTFFFFTPPASCCSASFSICSVFTSPVPFSPVFLFLFYFFFPAFLLSTNHRAWTRLPWPMPPFWMAAGAGPTVPSLAQWALWLSVFLLSLLSLTLSTPRRWAYKDRCWKHKQDAYMNHKTDNKCDTGPLPLADRC